MSNTTVGSGTTRRETLRKILLLSGAACVTVLGVPKIVDFIAKSNFSNPLKSNSPQTYSTSQGQTDYGSTAVPSSTTKTENVTSASNTQAYYTIKVAYFGMSVQSTGTKQEYIVFPAPVFLNDILNRIKEEHVVLVPMLSTMAMVINGTPAEGNPKLANNDEIDLIPTYAGG